MYKTINGWTKESMIDHIKANFKGKSVAEIDHQCLYRGPNGKKCAVGLFIPDSNYNSLMDSSTHGISASAVIEEYGLSSFMPLCMLGMSRLQSKHDISDPENTLKDMLQWIEENVCG